MQLNEKLPTFYEILKSANESDDPVKVLRTAIQKDKRVTAILGYALNPSWKMDLPPGIPPYIPSQHPIGIAPVEVLNTHNKLYVMYSNTLKRFKKEQMFVQWLEDMAPEEAELMVKIKDQSLPSAYEKLTLEVYIAAMGWSMEQYSLILNKSKTSSVVQ